MRKKFLYTLLALLLSCGHIWAEGSITLADIKPLLDQQPKLWECFTDRFDIQQDGWGTRVGFRGFFGGSASKVVGERIGPYVFLAKPKGATSDYCYRITITTDWGPNADPPAFFDEVLTGITVEPINTKSVVPFRHPKGP